MSMTDYTTRITAREAEKLSRQFNEAYCINTEDSRYYENSEWTWWYDGSADSYMNAPGTKVYDQPLGPQENIQVPTHVNREVLKTTNPGLTYEKTWHIPGCSTLRKAARNPWEYINEIQHIRYNSPEAEPYNALLKEHLRRMIISKDDEILASIPEDYDLNTVHQETWDMLVSCSDYYVGMDFYKKMPAEAAKTNLITEVLKETELSQPCLLVAVHENPAFQDLPLEWFMALWTTYPKRVQQYIKNNDHLEALKRP